MLKRLFIFPIFLIFICISSICNVSKSDQTVSEIQTMLKDQGYSIGVIDGKAGKNTIREIKNWQYLNAFDESGNINQEQLNILRNQNYLGKTLSNEEMKVIEERNKKVIEKNKKASAMKKKSNIQKSNNEISFFSWFPWQFWSVLILYIAGIIMTYYDDTFTKIARRNSYDASQIVRWAQGSGSAYYIKNYDPDYKYFIPNLLARLIEILLAGFIFFIITICIFFLIQYLFFNINVNIAILYSLVFTLFSGVCAMYGYGHYEAIYTGNKENLILVTFFSGLTLHLFLFLIGFDYLLIGEKAFYWLSGIFFFLSFKLWVVNDLISKYIKRITFFLGILFAVLAFN